MTNPTLSKIKQKSVPVLKRVGVTEAAVFGSFARGDARRGSDIDLLIRTPSGFGLLELVSLRDALRQQLNREVDLVSYRSVHPSMKRAVLKEAVRIL